MTVSFEDFYIPRSVERWVLFTLTFYVNGYEKKQTESCGPIWSLEGSSVLHLFKLDV
jgi:hypothetical protein